MKEKLRARLHRLGLFKVDDSLGYHVFLLFEKIRCILLLKYSCKCQRRFCILDVSSWLALNFSHQAAIVKSRQSDISVPTQSCFLPVLRQKGRC